MVSRAMLKLNTFDDIQADINLKYALYFMHLWQIIRKKIEYGSESVNKVFIF